MRTIETLLGEREAPRVPYILRPLQPGDIGWIVARHGTVYGREYGWDQTIEVLTAEIIAAFVRNFDPKRDCWLDRRTRWRECRLCVHREGRRRDRPPAPAASSILSARGLGIGTRLVEECLRFARRAGYKRVTLWTHRVLEGARKLYLAAGFKLSANGPMTILARKCSRKRGI